jgi:two-component system cell cycle sensor histidine kinase PleC
MHQTAEGGTGLGLPIVQNLVSLHGGTFELHSELRKGTEAVVILPRSRVLRSMPPLQPLGRERHRRQASDLDRPQLKPRAIDEPTLHAEESTAAP